MIIYSGFINSCNLTIITVFFPLLIWLWIYPSNTLFGNNINRLTSLISYALKIAFSWLLGFIPSFTISVTIATLLGNHYQSVISLSGVIFIIIAYLNWKSPRNIFHVITPPIFGFCSAIGWHPIVSQSLASILLDSLEHRWSTLLFVNAFAYSLGVGFAFCICAIVVVLIWFGLKHISLQINLKSRITTIKNKTINSHIVKAFLNSSFTKKKWYKTLAKFMSIALPKIFSKSSLHLILVFYGVFIVSGLLDSIQLWLLVLTWST